MKNYNSLGKTFYYLGRIFAIVLIVAIIGGIIQGVFGIADSIFDDDDDDKKDKTAISSEYIDTLDGYCLVAELKATELTISTGDKFEYSTNNEYIKVDQKDGKIVIKETLTSIPKSSDFKLNVTIPADRSFDVVSISTGAGDVTVDSLTARDFDFEIGAGDVTINNLAVTGEAEIDCGAGELNINNASLNNLELNSGVGEINITSLFTGDCEINSGIGEVNVNAVGSAQDYTVSVSKGAGDVTVNGTKVSRDTTVGSGQNKIELNGGIGEASISFTE